MEALILVPIAGALYAMGKKVAAQSETIANQGTTIEVLTRQIQEQQTSGARESSAVATGVVTVPQIAAGVGVAMLSYSGLKLWSKLRQRENTPKVATAVEVRRAPPTGYQPVKSLEEDCCVVCMHNKRDTLLDPCHHLCVCWPCAEELCHLGHEATTTGETRSSTAAPAGTPSSAANRPGSGSASRRRTPPFCPVCRHDISGLVFTFS